LTSAGVVSASGTNRQRRGSNAALLPARRIACGIHTPSIHDEGKEKGAQKRKRHSPAFAALALRRHLLARTSSGVGSAVERRRLAFRGDLATGYVVSSDRTAWYHLYVTTA